MWLEVVLIGEIRNMPRIVVFAQNHVLDSSILISFPEYFPKRTFSPPDLSGMRLPCRPFCRTPRRSQCLLGLSSPSPG